MLPQRLAAALAVLLLLGTAKQLAAHFLVLLPSTDVVGADDDKRLALEVLFTHPMQQGPVMDMASPRQFGVLVDGKKTDLLRRLNPKKIDGKSAFSCTFDITAPGDYVFFIEPAPYWEAAEQKMIVHYTKVVVDALGAEQGWDAMVGFPVEIEPLVRPFGLWTGNTFRGIVKRDGKPVPFATVEVEYNNLGRRVRTPNDAFTTQVVKADANGVFAYTMPRAGWWGFAALVDGDQKLKSPQGKLVDVELGALMWIKAVDMEEVP